MLKNKVTAFFTALFLCAFSGAAIGEHLEISKHPFIFGGLIIVVSFVITKVIRYFFEKTPHVQN